jgi:D-glycero-D-manno-heptose 1,7-bisphosphate phosphatase
LSPTSVDERHALRRAIFFDRDRTLIADAPPGLASVAAQSPEHVQLLPGAVEALRAAREAGFLSIVVTNQPGAAKGECTREALAATCSRLLALCRDAGAPIDDLLLCDHHPEGGPGGVPELIRECDCRKPKPGLILEAARRWSIDLSRSAIIGDAGRDLAAGAAAGVRGYLVGPGWMTITEAVSRAISENLPKA